eukprot:365749-Chlamydomonas_euryale.AAC.7
MLWPGMDATFVCRSSLQHWLHGMLGPCMRTRTCMPPHILHQAIMHVQITTRNATFPCLFACKCMLMRVAWNTAAQCADACSCAGECKCMLMHWAVQMHAHARSMAYRWSVCRCVAVQHVVL